VCENDGVWAAVLWCCVLCSLGTGQWRKVRLAASLNLIYKLAISTKSLCSIWRMGMGLGPRPTQEIPLPWWVLLRCVGTRETAWNGDQWPKWRSINIRFSWHFCSCFCSCWPLFTWQQNAKPTKRRKNKNPKYEHIYAKGPPEDCKEKSTCRTINRIRGKSFKLEGYPAPKWQ